jgi:hypothetical protein
MLGTHRDDSIIENTIMKKTQFSTCGYAETPDDTTDPDLTEPRDSETTLGRG